LAARLNAMGTGPGPARLKLALDLTGNAGQSDRVQARATVDLDSALLKGVTTITAKPAVAAIQGIDLSALRSSDIGIESKLSSEQGRALLGLDRTVAAGDGPGQFEGSATGIWGGPLRLKAKISAATLVAEAEGSAEPWGQEAKANVSLKVRGADFGPLLDLKPADTLAQNIGLSSRVQLTGNRLAFDDLDSSFGGSRLRGSVAVTLGEEKEIEGEIGAEQLALAPAFALALGAAGHDAAEPLGTGLAKGWRGRIAFQALRGLLPGGSELQPVSGVIKSDGQSLSFDAIKDRRRRGHRQCGCKARRERHCTERERPVLRRRRHGVALPQPRDACRPGVDADDADEPGPQRRGAGGRAFRQRNADAGSGEDCRSRSARLRGGGARQ
jgi:large subunit ribosomal protein L24